ncbi:trace amine-associated receptor 1-like [Anabas testudineus]|uniref:trace amine-associated receptor 1-like n=1 Tax=Anabas testudineus TaxID=64144 RepID=UPI000E465242|nr:trace amine-associated receptor 1-like [Anabas testudineus]
MTPRHRLLQVNADIGMELTVNSTYIYGTHPCYESDNTTYAFTTNPSIICVSVYIFLGFLSVCTICGNLLVIMSIAYFKQLHTPTNYLVLSLAVADLLVGVLVFPFSLAFSVTLCLYHEDFFCKLRDSFDVSLCTSSILNMCCISIDRYYAVCQPLTYRTKMNVHFTVIMILVSWGISALIGIGIIIAGFSQGTCKEVCSVDVAVANTIGPVLSFYLPAITILCIYLKIFLVAHKQMNRIQNTMCQSTKSGATVSKMERKATKTLATVMAIFLLCLTPYFFCVVFQPLAYNPPPASVIEALNWLTLSNSMLNPLIYAFFYSWFRSAFRMIISGKIFKGDSANTKLF